MPRTGKSASTATKRQTSPLHRILVVEDDGDTRRLNTEVLIELGCHVDAAEDGAVAWDTLQVQHYDLLVTDNEMPKVTGLELLKKLHAARKTLPVIMATGKLPKEEFTRHPMLQPDAILIKPYTIEEFLGTVKGVLRGIEQTREQIATMPILHNQPPADGFQQSMV